MRSSEIEKEMDSTEGGETEGEKRSTGEKKGGKRSTEETYSIDSKRYVNQTNKTERRTRKKKTKRLHCMERMNGQNSMGRMVSVGRDLFFFCFPFFFLFFSERSSCYLLFFPSISLVLPFLTFPSLSNFNPLLF